MDDVAQSECSLISGDMVDCTDQFIILQRFEPRLAQLVAAQEAYKKAKNEWASLVSIATSYNATSHTWVSPY